MRRALLIAAFLSARTAAQTCDAITVEARVPLHTTAPYYASANIDSSNDREFFMLDWTAPALVAAATGLGASGGTHIRFGGTGNNFLYYDTPSTPCVPGTPRTRTCLNMTTWSGIAALSAASKSPIIFGANFFPSTNKANKSFDPTNAVAFFELMKARGDDIWGVELGNELGPDGAMTPELQAAGLLKLDDALAVVYGDAPRPRLVGPDALGFHTPAPPARSVVPSADVLKYMTDFVVAMRGRLTAVTHHEYIEVNDTNILDPATLDLTYEIAQQVVAAVRNVSADVEVWAGEIGPHNGDGGPGDGRPGNCGSNLICGRWGSTIWYADAMAAKARAGYAAFCRQDMCVNPRPTFSPDPRHLGPHPTSSLPHDPSPPPQKASAPTTGSSILRRSLRRQTTGCSCCGRASSACACSTSPRPRPARSSARPPSAARAMAR